MDVVLQCGAQQKRRYDEEKLAVKTLQTILKEKKHVDVSKCFLHSADTTTVTLCGASCTSQVPAARFQWQPGTE